MIKQRKGKQRVTPCAWTLPYFIISLFSASFPYPSPVFIILPFCFPYFEKKREERDKGERIDKEDALFCLSLSFIHLSSIVVFALPIKNAILSISPPPSLSVLFNDKKHKEIIRGEWRPLSFLILFQWLGT